MNKKFFLIVMLAIILFISSSVQGEFKIILNFDDGYEGVYNNAFPIMKQYDIPGVLYVVIRTIGTDNHLSIDQLKELKKVGWEIGSHTIHHNNLEMLTPQGLIQEIGDSRKQLQKLGLIDYSYASFCSPMSKWNQSIKEVAAKHYQIARGKKLFIFIKSQSPEHNTGISDNTPVINGIIPKIVVKDTALSVFKKWVDEAIEQDKPLILVFHDIADGENVYSFSPEKFKEVIEFIKQYPIITFQGLFKQYFKD